MYYMHWTLDDRQSIATPRYYVDSKNCATMFVNSLTLKVFER